MAETGVVLCTVTSCAFVFPRLFNTSSWSISKFSGNDNAAKGSWLSFTFLPTDCSLTGLVPAELPPGWSGINLRFEESEEEFEAERAL